MIRWRLESGDRAAQLVSLSELRRGFEPAAAALAARRADPHQCRIMAAAVSDMVVHGRSGDLESYLLADKVFHQTLLEASGNEMFRALNGVVAEVLTGRTHHGMMPETPNPVAIALHDEVARAIRLRDEDGRRTRHAGDHRRGDDRRQSVRKVNVHRQPRHLGDLARCGGPSCLRRRRRSAADAPTSALKPDFARHGIDAVRGLLGDEAGDRPSRVAPARQCRGQLVLDGASRRLR